MFFHAMRAAGLVAASAVMALAGSRQASLQGVETGHFITNPGTTNPGTQGATIITDDFAEGIAPRLGKYTLIAREEINLQTGDVRDGAFVMTAADGSTIRGTYSGTAAFGATSAGWIADGSIAGGTGRFAKATGTIHLDGSSDLRTCETVGALSVCGFTETTAIELVLP
jgi:hypothetical protein